MKTKIKKTIFSLLVSSVLSSTVYAYSPSSINDSPYVSAQFGVSDKSSSNFENKKYTGRVAYGYLWNIDEQIQLGLEGGLNAYENAHYTYANAAAPDGVSTGTLKRVGLDLLGVFNFYATSHLDFFAKAGPAFSFDKFKYTSASNQLISSHKDRGALKFAVGLGYDLNDKTNLYLSRDFQTRHSRDQIERSVIPANSTSIGIRYKFC